MAVDAFMVFYPNSGNALTSESQNVFNDPAHYDPFPGSGAPLANSSYFEIAQWSFDVEQTLNIGSQSSGAGAGKIAFNPFSITRNVDVVSSTLFTMCAAGTPFKFVDLLVRKSPGDAVAARPYLAYRFGLVAIKSIQTASSDSSPQETVAFEYGSLLIGYAVQHLDGTLGNMVFHGWDRVHNKPI